MEVKAFDGLAIDTKINGTAIRYHVESMHESWLVAFITKGIQRLANDMYSGESGNVKYDLCKAIADQANSGEPAPERTTRKASLPDDAQLAIKMAKTDLTVLFKKITGAGKIADMVAHEKVEPFFKAKGESHVWNDETVMKWVGKQAEAGKRDYMAEAKATLEGDNAEVEAELDL